jgi:hypothetical protein
MQFDYEIPIEEYAAAQVLYYRAHAKRRPVKRALGWALLGLFLVLIAIFRWVADWGSNLSFADRRVVYLCGNRKPLPNALLSSYLPGIGVGWQELIMPS